MKTMPNLTGGRPFVRLEVALPECCPVSKNPQPGSSLLIQYRAKQSFLELYSLNAYIRRFIGGRKDAQGTIIIRDMETMIAEVAQHCADTVGVPVRVEARLKLVPVDMTLRVRGYPALPRNEEGASLLLRQNNDAPLEHRPRERLERSAMLRCL